MWRDMERICDALGLPLRRPDPFPQNSLLAARVALALDGESRAAFLARRLPRRIRRRPADRRSRDPRGRAERIGVEPEAALARAEDAANKERLKAECARAKSLGLPGAPCLVAEDGEIFWGNDRLEQGLDWATRAPAFISRRI